MTDAGDLLTCPFCGGDDLNVYKGHGGNKVQCRDCGVSGVHVMIWNRRADLVPGYVRIPEEGSPEEAAMVEAACEAYFDGDGYQWDAAKGADHVRASMRAALTAALSAREGGGK